MCSREARGSKAVTPQGLFFLSPHVNCPRLSFYMISQRILIMLVQPPLSIIYGWHAEYSTAHTKAKAI